MMFPGLRKLAAQTVVAVVNFSFESPTPTVFPDYTISATGWTLTRADIDAGTFAPALATPSVLPAPIAGNQVGYANGSGGLQQILGTNFVAGQIYTYSVWIGYRSDEVNSPTGTGTIELGTFDGTFHSLALQSATVALGQFNFVSGSYQAAPVSDGAAIVLRLTDISSSQVLFDVVGLSFTAIPEPVSAAVGLALVACGVVGIHRHRRRPPPPRSRA